MTGLYLFSGPVLFGFSLSTLLQLLVTAYAAALFLQSGFDKVLDWSGNRAYINGMFEKTILRPLLPLLMPVITLLEVGAGLCSLAGVVTLLLTGNPTLAITGLLLGAKSIFLLFTGLRIAKDYGAAAAITSYFIFFIGALTLFVVF
jgi:putative oxidoreductase